MLLALLLIGLGACTTETDKPKISTSPMVDSVIVHNAKSSSAAKAWVDNYGKTYAHDQYLPQTKIENFQLRIRCTGNYKCFDVSDGTTTYLVEYNLPSGETHVKLTIYKH